MSEHKSYEQALPVGFHLLGGMHDYTIEKVLGQGGFGITYKVRARIKAGNITVTTHFAIKEFFPAGCWRNEGSTKMLYSPTTKEEVMASLHDFITEGNRLQKLCQLNNSIVNVNEVFEANGTAYFVMEYLSGGDLRSLVKKNGHGMNEAMMMSIMRPVAEALQCLHNNNMLHLDIKPENIVIRQSDDGGPDVPVLIDFGIAVHFKKDGSPTTSRPAKGVTPGYSPAEQYAGIKRFDPRFDIYALSATCYYMITAKDPRSAFEIEGNDIAMELNGLVGNRTRDGIARGMAHSVHNRPPSITAFLNSFKESNALPLGTIIYGLNTSYIIMAVVDESPFFVQYKASSIENEHNGTAVSRIQYDIWEQLNNGKRIPFVSSGVVRPRVWNVVPFLNKSGYDLQGYGCYISKQGAIDSEYFNAAGVDYLTIREGYNPSKAKKSRFRKFETAAHVPVNNPTPINKPIPVNKPEPVSTPSQIKHQEPILEAEPILETEQLLETDPILDAEPIIEPEPFKESEMVEESAIAVESKPIEEPEPVEEPVKEPVEEPAEEPVEESIAAPAEEPVEESVEESVEEPAEESIEEPEPVEEPIEEPIEEPVEEPVEQPSEEPEPVEKPVEEPAEESVEELAEEHVEKPIKEYEPVKEPEPVKKPEPIVVSEPISTPVPVSEPEPVKEYTYIKKSEPVKKNTPIKKSEPAKKHTPAKKHSPVKKSEPIKKTKKPIKTESHKTSNEISGGAIESKDAGKSKKPLFIALGVLAIVVLAGLATWLMKSPGNGSEDEPSTEVVSTSDVSASGVEGVSAKDATLEEHPTTESTENKAKEETPKKEEPKKEEPKKEEPKKEVKEEPDWKGGDAVVEPKGKAIEPPKPNNAGTAADAQRAYANGNIEKLKQMARNGNTKAQSLLKASGESY